MPIVLLSPAKAMDWDKAIPVNEHTAPRHLQETAILQRAVAKLSKAELKKLMSLSDSLAALNHQRFQDWTTQSTGSQPQENAFRQAIYTFDGPAFRGVDVRQLDDQHVYWLQQHLRVLSGLYGLLRPLDLIQPYRLEMATSLHVVEEETASLYEFWSKKELTQTLLRDIEETGDALVVNAASQEYSKVLDWAAIRETARVVDVVFKDEGRVVSTFAKRARGLFVRFMAMNAVATIEQMKQFDLEGYAFSETESSADELVFHRSKAQRPAPKAKRAKTESSIPDKPVKQAKQTRAKRSTSRRK